MAFGSWGNYTAWRNGSTVNNFRIGIRHRVRQDIPGNRSEVQFQLRVEATTATAWAGTGVSSFNIVLANRTSLGSWGATVTQTVSSNGQVSGNSTRTILDFTRILNHANNGTGGFTWSATVTGTAGWAFTMGSGLNIATQNIDLPTIARTSQATVANFTAFTGRGVVQSNRASSSFTHRYRFAVRNTTATNTTDGFTNASFTQVRGWRHFTGASANIDFSASEITEMQALLTAMAGANTRQFICEVETRNGPNADSPLIGTVTIRGTVTAPNANTVTMGSFSAIPATGTAVLPVTISRVTAGTGQTGTLNSNVEVRVGTTVVATRTNQNWGATHNITLTSAELDAIVAAMPNTGWTANNLNVRVRTVYSSGQPVVRGWQTSGDRTVSVTLPTLPAGSTVTNGGYPNQPSVIVIGNRTPVLNRVAGSAPTIRGVAPTSVEFLINGNVAHTATTNLNVAGTQQALSTNIIENTFWDIRTNYGTRGSISRRINNNPVHHFDPSFNPTASRGNPLTTINLGGSGSFASMNGFNFIRVRTRHRTRPPGTTGGTWSGWTNRATPNGILNATITSIPENQEIEIEFQVEEDANVGRWLPAGFFVVGLSAPTLFIGDRNHGVGVGAFPSSNELRLGEGVNFINPRMTVIAGVATMVNDTGVTGPNRYTAWVDLRGFFTQQPTALAVSRSNVTGGVATLQEVSVPNDDPPPGLTRADGFWIQMSQVNWSLTSFSYVAFGVGTGQQIWNHDVNTIQLTVTNLPRHASTMEDTVSFTGITSTGGTMTFTRNGAIVCISSSMNFNGGANPTGGGPTGTARTVTIGILPVGWRPRTQAVRFRGFTENGQSAELNITTGGDVSVRRFMTAPTTTSAGTLIADGGTIANQLTAFNFCYVANL